jgi:hypothetical protein
MTVKLTLRTLMFLSLALPNAFAETSPPPPDDPYGVRATEERQDRASEEAKARKYTLHEHSIVLAKIAAEGHSSVILSTVVQISCDGLGVPVPCGDCRAHTPTLCMEAKTRNGKRCLGYVVDDGLFIDYTHAECVSN